ncbi:MAG: trimethylamine methyltransferase family protein [Bacteroidota bacterium]
MTSTMLSDEQIGRVHEASLRILGEIGVEVPHADMLSRFAEAGARVDFERRVVRIPADCVENCLRTAGKQFSIFGRDESKTARFGQGTRNFNSIAGEASWIEELGGPRRYARLADVAVAARLGDALPNINIVGAMTDPHDVPAEVACVEVLAELVRHTTKPVTLWYHDRASAKYLNEIQVALRGSEEAVFDRPYTYPFLEPISPLRFPFNGIDLLYETAKLNLPVPIGPMAQTGLSAPSTLAGTMAHENAEILAGVCVTQLIREGMPVCYGGICHAFDMRTTQLIFSGPEQAIFGVAMTQMGKHYGLPVYINVGLTDSKRVDAQAGLEAGISLALGAAAGADIFGHMGISGVDQASSADMLVFQDEVIGFVESTMRDMDFSDEAFGFETSVNVGPGGSFIAEEHTARNFRKEVWQPTVLDREYYQAWRDSGASSTEERVVAKRKELLATHEVEPVSEELEKALRGITAGARRELCGG